MTSTLSNRLLLEVGYSTNIERLSQRYQPAIEAIAANPFSTDWYRERHAQRLQRQRLGSGARRVDRHLSRSQGVLWRPVVRDRLALTQGAARSGRSAWTATRRSGPAISSRTTSMSPARRAPKATLDGCAPNTVTVYNTPTRYFEYVNYDLGIYAQDTWTLKRLTLSPGIRFDKFNAEEPGRLPQGRPLLAGVLPRRCAGPAELEQPRAANGGGVRPLRQRQDRDQGQRQQVHAAVVRRLGQALRPVHDRHRLAELAGLERRRHRPGQRDRSERQRELRRLDRPVGRTRTLRASTTSKHAGRPASAAAAAVGVRRLLPSPLLQPGSAAESAADGCRLDVVPGRQPDSATARRSRCST